MHARHRMHVDRGQPLEAGRPVAARQPECARPGHPADGRVRVARETRGRKGKGVTLVTGLALAPDQLDALCRQLKQRCGAGGSVKHGVIELQGDQRDTVLAELKARGFDARQAGG